MMCGSISAERGPCRAAICRRQIPWRIYYDGGATYDGNAWDAPVFGALVIVEHDFDHGRRLVMAADYYVYRDYRWYGVDWIGMVDYLAQPGPKRVLFGRTVPSDYFNMVVRCANTDPDFPIRTAWGARERKVE